MTIADIRNRVATIAETHDDIVVGYPRPDEIADLPAVIVQDPDSIEYHTAHGGRTLVEIKARVIVPRYAEADAVERLDELLSYAELPTTLEAGDPAGNYGRLVCDDMSGGYIDVVDADGNPYGVGADLNLTIITTR